MTTFCPVRWLQSYANQDFRKASFGSERLRPSFPLRGSHSARHGTQTEAERRILVAGEKQVLMLQVLMLQVLMLQVLMLQVLMLQVLMLAVAGASVQV